MAFSFFTDSQSDADLSAVEADVLDLTSGVREIVEQTEVTESEQVSTNKQTEEPTLELDKDDQDEHEEREDDAVSNKSLDLNFASKLMDFKLSPNEHATSHSCDICGKSFKFPATLGRHKKAHTCESSNQEKSSEQTCKDSSTHTCNQANQDPSKETGDEEEELPVDLKVSKSPVESEQAEHNKAAGEGVSEDKIEKSLDKSDDEKDSKAETKGTKADKRKKICTVCSKRFWSLQDLTRHMRSHTG